MKQIYFFKTIDRKSIGGIYDLNRYKPIAEPDKYNNDIYLLMKDGEIIGMALSEDEAEKGKIYIEQENNDDSNYDIPIEIKCRNIMYSNEYDKLCYANDIIDKTERVICRFVEV